MILVNNENYATVASELVVTDDDDRQETIVVHVQVRRPESWYRVVVTVASSDGELLFRSDWQRDRQWLAEEMVGMEWALFARGQSMLCTWDPKRPERSKDRDNAWLVAEGLLSALETAGVYRPITDREVAELSEELWGVDGEAMEQLFEQHEQHEQHELWAREGGWDGLKPTPLTKLKSNERN